MTTAGTEMVPALGWALVHFTWQGAVAGLLFALLDLAARGASARLRYALAAATLLAMVLLPPLTILSGDHPAGRALAPAPSIGSVASASDPGAPIRQLAAPARAGAGSQPILTAWIDGALPAIVGVWGVGVLLLSVRYLGGWRLVRRLDRFARPVADPAPGRLLAGLARRMRVSRPVRLLESALVEVPTVVGALRPAVLLPVATLAGLTPEQLEAVLAHELAHVRRHDYLASLLQGAVETLLFYHPAVWWVSHRMRVERELCCDDEAVAACGNPLQYARALADLESLRPAPRLAPAATGGPLFERIARLVAAPTGPVDRLSRGAAALVAIAAMSLVVAGLGSMRASAEAQTTTAGTDEKARPAKSARPPSPRSAAPRAAAKPTEASAVTATPAAQDAAPAATRPVPVERLIELAGAGVTPDYVDALAALGYPDLSWDKLIELRSQGVSADYVRGLAAAGHAHLTPDQLVALRSQGVTPDYVRALAAEGLRDRSVSELIELRSHGVSAEYVRGLKAAGQAGLSVTDLLGARSQGVSPEDAAALRAMGYTDLSVSRLIGLRSQGVTAEYVRGLQAEGYRGLSVPVLFALRSQGVTVEYVRELKNLGYTGLAAGELIELRSQGVTPDYVQELKAAGFDRLSVRELVELRSHGVDPALLKRLKGREVSQ